MAKRIGYPIQLYRGHENDLPLLDVGELAYTYNDLGEDRVWVGSKRGVNCDITGTDVNDISVATDLANGLMSKEDKAKLNDLSSDTATVLKDGLMSKEDKAKLDGLKSIESSVYDAIITGIWDGASAPFTQRLIVRGIKATDNPIVFPKYSSDSATALLEYDTWQKISNITTADNLITVHCFEEAPTTDLSIQLKVVG